METDYGLTSPRDMDALPPGMLFYFNIGEKISMLIRGSDGVERVFEYIQVNGVYYHADTPWEAIFILERYRFLLGEAKQRLILHNGDVKTGQAWGDQETGMIGTTTGWLKVPILVYNKRSLGGYAILDHCIVKIETARGKYVLWQHPNYHEEENDG